MDWGYKMAQTRAWADTSPWDISPWGSSPWGISPLGHFAVGTFRRWEIAPLGHFAVGRFRRWVISPLGHFAVGTFRRQDISPSGHFAVRTFRRGTFRRPYKWDISPSRIFFCFSWTIPCKGKAFMHVKFFCTFFSKFFNLSEPRSGDIFVRAKMVKYSSSKDACRRHIYYIGLTRLWGECALIGHFGLWQSLGYSMLLPNHLMFKERYSRNF